MAEKFGIDLSNISLKKFKPRKEDIFKGIIMSLGSLSDKKLGYIEKRLRGLNSSELINLKSLIYKEENVLQRLNLVYQAMAKADNDRLIKEKETRIEQGLSEGFQKRVMPKLRKLEIMAREGKVDMQSYMNFLEVYKTKLRDGEITLEQYEKQLELKVNELLGIKDPSKKNDKLLIYGLIGVVGYLLYKNSKK
tara:strand:+ start:2240 stop:2818 length:579 start_codon:yes stop_codon:yes gene_type:complete